jgi:hypothetical protein
MVATRESDMTPSKELLKLDDRMWEAHQEYAYENDKDWANADELREDGLKIGEDAFALDPSGDEAEYEDHIEGDLKKFFQPFQMGVVSAAAYCRYRELQEEAAAKADKALAVAADIAGVA